MFMLGSIRDKYFLISSAWGERQKCNWLTEMVFLKNGIPLNMGMTWKQFVFQADAT